MKFVNRLLCLLLVLFALVGVTVFLVKTEALTLVGAESSTTDNNEPHSGAAFHASRDAKTYE